jgi:hypothetical protein
MAAPNRMEHFFVFSTIIGLSTFFCLRNAPVYDVFSEFGFDYDSIFFGTPRLT